MRVTHHSVYYSEVTAYMLLRYMNSLIRASSHTGRHPLPSVMPQHDLGDLNIPCLQSDRAPRGIFPSEAILELEEGYFSYIMGLNLSQILHLVLS